MRNPLVAILALVGFVCASAFGFAPVARAGVQCPTAAVQTLAVRDCCNRIVFRKPRPGDRAFVQCRCAEKRAANEQGNAPTRPELYAERTFAFDAPEALASDSVRHVYTRPYPSPTSPPTVRPPTSV